MSTQPFLPLYFGDLLAATARWSGEKRALYILLLAYQWSSGPLPETTEEIAEMCQYKHSVFVKLWETVGTKFVKSEGGLINQRLEEHRKRAIDISNKRAIAGAKGAAKTWQKEEQTDSKQMANAMANATNLPCHPILSYPEEESKSGSAASGEHPDPRKQLFDLGVSILGADARSLIGKGIRNTSEAHVGAVLGEMAISQKADPRTYFAAATKKPQTKLAV